jgi:hypothetical protein
MEYTPEMIDALAVQLRGALKVAENIPDHVREAAEKFTDSLDKWSEELRKAGS